MRFLKYFIIIFIIPLTLFAGWTDTAPKHILMMDLSYRTDTTSQKYDKDGNVINLSENMEFYDSKGRLQGTLEAPAVNIQKVGLYQLAYGITDTLTLAVVIPHIRAAETDLNLHWIPGEFDPALGRAMTLDDFCAYIQGMGQSCPEDWHSKPNRLGDVVVGFRYLLYQKSSLRLATLMFASTRSGKVGDQEILGAVGTTGYEFGSNGDFGFHFIAEKKWKSLSFNGEVLYEPFITRTFPASTGSKNPLLLNNSYYIGDEYKIKPGDYFGISTGLIITVIKGPDSTTWLTKDNPEMQKQLPPLLTVEFDYKKIWGAPDRFYSNSEVFNRGKESGSGWKEKNTLISKLSISLFRVGIPFDIYGTYSNQELLGGKSFMPLKEWGLGINLYYSLDIWPL